MVSEAHCMSFPCTELLLFNYAKVKTVFHSMAPLKIQQTSTGVQKYPKQCTMVKIQTIAINTCLCKTIIVFCNQELLLCLHLQLSPAGGTYWILFLFRDHALIRQTVIRCTGDWQEPMAVSQFQECREQTCVNFIFTVCCMENDC